MKTITRLVRRNIFAAFGIVSLVFLLNLSLFLGLVVHFGRRQADAVPIGALAGSFTRTASGDILPDGTLNWQDRFAWAMLLDDGGNILWSRALPDNLNHRYTVPETASFSRWYLDDYPVLVYRNDFGLLVAGRPRDSMARFDFYMDNDVLNAMRSGLVPLLLADAGLVLAACLLLGWRESRSLRAAGDAIDRLAAGEGVQLEERGATAELARKLNRAGALLRRQGEQLARRDAARTQWIAGVSHDIRTPLALVMGYAERIERAAPPDSDMRRSGAAIRAQGEKIRALIEDLNLTSKLQYAAQPLRLAPTPIGPMLRRCVAAFCDTLDARYAVDVTIPEDVDRTVLSLDGALVARALDNLLNNCARHNPCGCHIAIDARRTGDALEIAVRDDGPGYPDDVLRVLRGEQPQGERHILGLHLARQIAEAHGGTLRLDNPGGARAVISLQCA